MQKKWKILIVVLLFVMSYSIFEASRLNVQIGRIQTILNPYNTYHETNKEIVLLGADDTELLKEELMNLSDHTEVSFIVKVAGTVQGGPGQTNNGQYYWYLQDDKYLSENMDLNRSLDVKTFNNSQHPITNNPGDDYYFELPLDNYHYEIFPFHLYEPPNLSTRFSIFAESEQNVDAFLRGLEDNGIMYTEQDPFVYDATFLQSIRVFLFLNPLMPLTIGLFFILLFAALYQDRRNLSIKLINGYSKAGYIREKLKSLTFILLITFISFFIAYYLLSYAFQFKHFFPLLTYYVPVIFIINVAAITFVAIVVYSFTDIDQKTYVQGIKAKGFTSYFIGFAKLIMGILIILSLIPTVFNIIQSVTIYQSLSQQMDRYENMYRIDSRGEYMHTMIEKSDEMIESLQGFDNTIYLSHTDRGDTVGEYEAINKLVYVNENYMMRRNFIDNTGNPIDPEWENVVYTTANNLEGLEEIMQLFPQMLNQTEGEEIETVVLDPNSELTMYNRDPYTDSEYASQDFIMVPQRDNFFILSFFFVFENEEQMEHTQNQLAGVVDMESIQFTKITDSWERELEIYQNSIVENTFSLLNYLIIMVILSLIYYQMKLDKVRKEFSVFWVNGISKFKYFYADYFYQLLLGGIMILLVRIIGYPNLSLGIALVIFIFYIGIDTLSLIIFRHRFYSQLQRHIKERV